MSISDKSFIVVLYLLFFVSPHLTASATEVLTLRDEDILAFADHLYRNGEYYRSISEYQRLIHYFPESESVAKANLQIGRAYMAGGKLKEAIRHWDLELEKRSQKRNFFTINSLAGISWLDLNRAKTLTLRLDNLKNAKKYFNRVKGEIPPLTNVQKFLDDWKKQPQLKDKSPWVAGALSAVLPGSGSFYTGRFVEGSYAFLITGLFFLATKDAISEGQNEIGLLLGFFTITFYGGNIYTAVNSAYKFNDYQDADQLRRLRKRWGIWFIPQTHSNQGQF
ncbi:MAG: hypothetical protein GY786_11360 [Proteobacteria bacterium]|nr:hypothetical protein [Pseudomonadota bacterium]